MKKGKDFGDLVYHSAQSSKGTSFGQGHSLTTIFNLCSAGSGLGRVESDRRARAALTGSVRGPAGLEAEGADWPGAPQGGPHHQSEQLGVHQPRGSQGDQD